MEQNICPDSESTPERHAQKVNQTIQLQSELKVIKKMVARPESEWEVAELKHEREWQLLCAILSKEDPTQ